MALTSAQLEQELKRKAALGIKPTNQANQGAYDKIRAQLGQAQPQTQPKVDNGLGIRKYFEDAGLKDIGFDKTRNMVTVGGMDALTPNKVVNGQSMAGGDALNAAVMRIRNQQNTNKTNALLGQLEGLMSAQPETPQFNYDPQSDPVYQAAVRRAKANAQTATGNAMAAMNSRGLLNSTIMGDRAAQIQQAEMGRVSDELVPQLFEQAYNRHRDSVSDQYTQRRDSLKDLYDLIGVNNDLGTQYYDRSVTEREYMDTKAANEAKVKADAESAKAKADADAEELTYNRMWDAADITGVLPDYLAEMYGLPKGTKTIEAEKLGVSRMNAETSQYNSRTSRMNANTSAFNAETSRANSNRAESNVGWNQFESVWAKTGEAPYDFELGNGYVIEKGTKYTGQFEEPDPSEPAKVDPKDSAEFMDEARGYISSMSKKEAKAYLAEIRGYFTDSDYRELLKEANDLQ